MNTCRRFVNGFWMLGMLLGVVGCESSTQLSTTWRDPKAPPISFHKVAVVVLNSTPGERRSQEDALASQITHATAIASYTFVPDAELADREKVKAVIRQSGFDGAVVLRLVDSQKQSTYIPGSTSYWYDGVGYAPYASSPGRIETDTIIRAEVSLYTVPEGKLLWVGSSTTTNPTNASEFALGIATAAVAELRKQGLLQ